MSTENNKVMLGQPPIKPDLRDAVHVAVVSCIAGEELKAGDFVHIVDSKAYKTKESDALGAVDPFIGSVPIHCLFWLCLNPGSVKNLRHEWDHPAFVDPNAKSAAMERMRGYAAEMGITYDELMAAADKFATDGKTTYSASFDFPDWGIQSELFWKDYKIITGKTCEIEGPFIGCCI